MSPLEHKPPDATPRCPYCGHELSIIRVNGRGQCMTCGEKVDPDREGSTPAPNDDLVIQ